MLPSSQVKSTRFSLKSLMYRQKPTEGTIFHTSATASPHEQTVGTRNPFI